MYPYVPFLERFHAAMLTSSPDHYEHHFEALHRVEGVGDTSRHDPPASIHRDHLLARFYPLAALYGNEVDQVHFPVCIRPVWE